jgi:phenylalanyl-tRNA synthetase alpha chain
LPISEWQRAFDAFERREVSREEALALFDDQPYKHELIREMPEGEVISIYKHGDFVDLCRGPHVANTSYLKANALALLNTAAAYWRGDEKRPMLQRIYGTIWNSKEELQSYLDLLAEIERRDHRRLGKELDLFSLHEDAGAGLVYWHPKGARIRAAELEHKLANERLDISLPGRREPFGRLHPATRVLNEICQIFGEMGFQIYRSPEVETDEINFELLNIPAHHPARDLWDTFHTTQPGVILRTHTSPGQIRAMHEMAPNPVRVILPGMVYRYEQTNASHEMQFDQVELLAVGRNITMGDLRGTIDGFVRRMFGDHVRTRLRPSYFPFTEPSAEVDMECFICGGKGCAVCKDSGWLEIGGCGMVHPIVLQNGGYDPKEFSGFAAGLGPERIAMLKYHIDDIRYFWGNDVRFLEQF